MNFLVNLDIDNLRTKLIIKGYFKKHSNRIKRQAFLVTSSLRSFHSRWSASNC